MLIREIGCGVCDNSMSVNLKVSKKKKSPELNISNMLGTSLLKITKISFFFFN